MKGRRMMSNFFEYKYSAMENYYKYICELSYSHGQATGRCLIDFEKVIDERGIEAVAVVSTILYQICSKSHDFNYYKKNYEELLEMIDNLDISNLLDENEQEYLFDDLEYIKDKFEV